MTEQDRDTQVTIAVGGLVVALCLLVIGVAVNVLVITLDDSRDWSEVDVAGLSTTGGAILAIVTALGAFLNHTKKRD